MPKKWNNILVKVSLLFTSIVSMSSLWSCQSCCCPLFWVLQVLCNSAAHGSTEWVRQDKLNRLEFRLISWHVGGAEKDIVKRYRMRFKYIFFKFPLQGPGWKSGQAGLFSGNGVLCGCRTKSQDSLYKLKCLDFLPLMLQPEGCSRTQDGLLGACFHFLHKSIHTEFYPRIQHYLWIHTAFSIVYGRWQPHLAPAFILLH